MKGRCPSPATLSAESARGGEGGKGGCVRDRASGVGLAGGAVVPWAPVTWNTFKRRRTRRRTRKLLQSWSGSRRRESGPEAEGRQSVGECARNRFICSATLRVRNAYIAGNRSPAVQAPPNFWFACTGHRTLRVDANGGWGHVHAAGGAAHRNFRTPGGRPGSLGRCPLTELGRDPVRRHGRPSRPLLRA